MADTLTLIDSPRLRYATGAVMYFAQGIPQGLLSIALPAWLASQGASAGEIGSYLAVIILPWAFKLITGPFMDRYQFPPMGQRRPWVLGAQLGLAFSLLGLALIENPAEQIGLLMLVGVVINCFAATQDVAVDGMSIDLTPVNEQGRLNAFMSFGKAAGWSITAAVSGSLLAAFGMRVTAVVAAVAAAVVFVMFVYVLEREGERRLPWSSGGAAGARSGSGSFRDVFGGINQVLWKRASLVILAIMFFDGLVSGYGHALMPVAAINVFGYTTPQWSQLVAVMGLLGAVASLAMGPGIDRFGAKRMMVLTVSLVGVHAFLLAQTQFLWHDTTYVRVMLSLWVLMMPLVMVCSIALAMAVCSSHCSATQFAIYMSLANLGHAAGSKLFGLIAEQSGYVEIYLLMGALVLATVGVLMFHRYGKESDAGARGKAVRRYTIGTGDSAGGTFFSGAIRCPKCRADMEQIRFEDTIVDRCRQCGGLWFDAGELERLRDRDAVAALDTGDAKVGRRYDAIDEYRCPRCGGEMRAGRDAQQSHIRFESCAGCEGSFFDAGEFRDIAELTVSDFFKRWLSAQRS